MNENERISAERVEEWNESMRANVERELAAFRRLLPRLLAKRKGWFVAVSGRRVVDEDKDEFALAARVTRRFKDRFVLVQEVTDVGRSSRSNGASSHAE
jgi:hypothetical protein